MEINIQQWQDKPFYKNYMMYSYLNDNDQLKRHLSLNRKHKENINNQTHQNYDELQLSGGDLNALNVTDYQTRETQTQMDHANGGRYVTTSQDFQVKKLEIDENLDMKNGINSKTPTHSITFVKKPNEFQRKEMEEKKGQAIL